jgi:hypothetical protein
MQSVVVPVLGGTAGFIAARTLGNFWAMKGWLSSDPRVAKSLAAGVGIPLTFLAARTMPMIAKNSGPIVLGMGLAAAEAWIRDTPLLGGSGAAAAMETPSLSPADLLPPTELVPPPSSEAASGFGEYVSQPLGQTDYYVGSMLGDSLTPGDQGLIDHTMNRMESTSTIVPNDLALRARFMRQREPITTPFASGDKGYAGGVFARHLFSGMMGG